MVIHVREVRKKTEGLVGLSNEHRPLINSTVTDTPAKAQLSLNAEHCFAMQSRKADKSMHFWLGPTAGTGIASPGAHGEHSSHPWDAGQRGLSLRPRLHWQLGTGTRRSHNCDVLMSVVATEGCRR